MKINSKLDFPCKLKNLESDLCMPFSPLTPKV